MSDHVSRDTHVRATFRMYTQHNVFFVMRITPLAALILGVVGWLSGDSDWTSPTGLAFLALASLSSPIMGLIFLLKRGPLVIDPVAETLTYRRHVFPFEQLGLVRVGSEQVLFASVGAAASGMAGDAAKIKTGIVGSGDFCLAGDDHLPRKRLYKLANHLNAVLADYYERRGEPIAPASERIR